MHRSGRLRTIAVLAALALTGCGNSSADGAARPGTAAPIATSTPTSSPSPRPTTSPSPTIPLPTPTPTPSPSPSPLPTPTLTPTPAPSPTPAPTPTPAGSWPDVGLAGVNDPDCTDDRPPVLLLHGTFSTAASNFGPLSRALATSGRCVFALDYGNWGTAAVKDSATTVAAFADRILAETGTEQLDVVGYSQGGLVLRTALRLNGVAPLVRTAVLIAPSFHGTSLDGLGDVPLQFCPACRDQLAGSELLAELDAGGDLDADVRYAVLSTVKDQVVLPVAGQSPQGPPDRVRTLLVEDLCPTLVTDHVALPATAAAVSWTLSTLDDWPADPADVTC